MTAAAPRPAGKDPQRVESGRKGGQTTSERHGTAHFSTIGKEGGKKGGQVTKERYGIEHYSRIGRKGGAEAGRRVNEQLDEWAGEAGQ